MIGLGRGSMLMKMLETNTTTASEEKPSKPLKTIGRGTSLMTPSQFMKSTSNRTVTAIKPLLKDDIKKDLSFEENNTKMKELTLSAIVDNKQEEENIDYLAVDNLQVCSDVNEECVSNVVSKFDELTDVALGIKPDAHTKESVTEDEAIPKQTSDVKTDGVPSAPPSDIFNNASEQRPTKPIHNFPVEQKHSDTGKAKICVPYDDTKEKTIEKSEDEKWKLYQVERKINEIIKNVTVENIGETFEELECLVEERPLSSRFTDCSEVQILTEAIMKNAVQRADFLPLAPCLIKMVSEHQPIEFKRDFQELCDTKCKQYVTLSASDDYLNNHGQQFCKLLGHLFAMPRQTGPALFNILIGIVGEYVERWSFPEGTLVFADGLQEQELAVHATALKYLLLEITQKMMSCDNEVEARMEEYVWFMRESVLNAKLPRKVREIYLDGIMEIQSYNNDESDDNSTAPHDGTNSQDDSEIEITYATDAAKGTGKVKAGDSCNVDAKDFPSQELKSEICNPDNAKKEENDFDFSMLENPPIDTIAMAPTNAYDSSRSIPKLSTCSGFRGMAMIFNKKPATSNNFKDTEDSDPDIIIEDEYNDSDSNQENSVKNNTGYYDDRNDADDDADKNDQIQTSQSIRLPSSSPFVKNKLPLGRGRGLARLPDFSANSRKIPVANVVPIGYQYEDMNRNERCPPSIGQSKPGEIRRMDNMHQRQGDGPNIHNGGNNYQYRDHDFNDDRREPFRPHHGGRQNNGMATDNFQNNRRGGSGNGRNYPFKNNNTNNTNNAGQNTSWREKPKFRNNNNSNKKPKKMKFRPVYHEKNNNSNNSNNNNNNNNYNFNNNNKDDRRNVTQPKDEMEKVYHPNGRLEYKPKAPESQSGGFGSVIPKTCLRCNSHDHLAEECPDVNMFF